MVTQLSIIGTHLPATALYVLYNIMYTYNIIDYIIYLIISLMALHLSQMKIYACNTHILQASVWVYRVNI